MTRGPGLVPHVLLFLSAAGMAAAATVIAGDVALRTGFVDRPAPHKFHARPTPYLGGVAVGATVVAVLGAALVSIPELRWEIASIALATAALMAVGLVDDRKPLHPAPRVAAQVLAGSALWTAGIRIETASPVLALVATVLVVVLITNAVNLLDNMDGLTAGTAFIAALFLFLAGHWRYDLLASITAMGAAGASAGFLLFNYHPARIFLGDAGTMLLGFLLSALVVRLDAAQDPAAVRVAVPVLALAVPLFDTALVVLSRLRSGRPVLKGGTDHSSHRLVALGVSPTATALLTYGTATMGGLAAAAVLMAGTTEAGAAALLVAAVLALTLFTLLERVPIHGESRAAYAPGGTGADMLPSVRIEHQR